MKVGDQFTSKPGIKLINTSDEECDSKIVFKVLKVENFTEDGITETEVTCDAVAPPESLSDEPYIFFMSDIEDNILEFNLDPEQLGGGIIKRSPRSPRRASLRKARSLRKASLRKARSPRSPRSPRKPSEDGNKYKR